MEVGRKILLPSAELGESSCDPYRSSGPFPAASGSLASAQCSDESRSSSLLSLRWSMMEGALGKWKANMEGSSPTEKGRATRSTKQCSSNSVRRNFPPGSAESSSNQLVRAAKEPAGLSRAAHSVLEAKVKALKEKRLATKPGGAVSQEGASLKKPKVRKGKHMPGLAVAERVSQDAVVEPQAQIRTYLTDVLLDSSDNVNLGLGARRAVVADLYADNAEALKAHQTRGVGSAWDCSSAEEVWRVQSPGRNVLEKPDCYLETRTQRGSPNGLWGTSSAKNPASSSQKSSLEENGKPTPFEEELPQARDLESIPLVPKDDLCGGLAPSEQLWGTESWGSVGSATSVLSLAERVERNRALLQEMLSLSRQNRSPLEPRKSRCHEREALRLTKDGTAQDQLANDLDWDSGVSLQDSEGYRPFVPTQELELSPRHEKAKQLLQRARMKARTSPLRASHDILPAVLQARREAGRSAALDLKKSFALKDGEAQASGNLSDSSSGESSCGKPRKRGPSPSRVRFEDESVRDAEVRYLERSQLRQKRVLDSVLLTLGQSPLVSKPDLSDYVNGDFYCPEHGVSKACKERQSHGQAAGASVHLGSRGSSEKAGPTVLSAEGKCKACGSYISGSAVNQYADDRAGQSINRLLEGRSIAQENKTVSITADSGEPGASQHETRGRTLGPRGSPLWILPSRQSIHTERIRETYIGEVTYIDDVDSALDSTDTSDSCRTDSEEAGPGSPYTVGSQDPGGCWPGGHQASRGTGALEKDPKGRKGGQEKCRVNGSGGDRVLDNASGTGRAAVGEERNSSLKEMEVLKEGQGTNPPASEVKALSKGDQPPAPPPLVGKDSSRGRAVLTPTQQRHIHPLPPHGPVPPPTGKALSPVPYTGGRDQTSDIATRPTSPPSKRSSGPEEQRSQCSPKVLSKDRLLALSTNNCNNTRARRQHDGPAPGMAPRQPEATGSDQKGKSNGLSSAAAPSAALRTISSAGITLSLASEEMGPTQAGRLPSGEAPALGSQQFADRHTPLGSCPEPKKPSASAASKKGGSSSATGLKKFFCTLSQTTKQKLGRFQSYSMEQIPPDVSCPAPPLEAGAADATDCSNLKKAPSLQSLRLVSPFCQLRKASSVQNLHSLLRKADRSSLYLVGEPGENKAVDRKAGVPPRRSLSVEDIGAPDLMRTVGRVIEVFPDGTSQLELQRPPQGTFGFRVCSGNGRPDTGIYVQEMADANTAKLYAGLLGVGDEILEVNGAKVIGLGLAHINELLLRADTLCIRVLKQRPPRR